MYSKNLVFAAACTGMFLFGVSLITLGSLLPYLTEKFRMDAIAAGSLTALLPFGLLAGSVIFGPFADKYGYKNLLIIFSLLVMFSLIAISFTNSLFPLQVLIFLLGTGSGVLNGSTNALVSDISSDRRAGLNFLGVFYGLGALGMPAVLSILSNHFTYDQIIAATGVSVLFPLFFFLTIKFPSPKQPQGISFTQNMKLLKNPLLLLFGFILFFQSGMEGLMNNWTTTYLIDLGADPEKALLALSYLIMSLTITRFFLSTLLKKISFKTTVYISYLITAAGTCLLFFASGYSTALTGLIMMGAGFAAVFPLMFGAAGKIFSGFSGTAFSIILTISLAGNMLLNYLTGIVAHEFGIRNYSLIPAGSLLIILFLFETVLKKLKAEFGDSFRI